MCNTCVTEVACFERECVRGQADCTLCGTNEDGTEIYREILVKTTKKSYFFSFFRIFQRFQHFSSIFSVFYHKMHSFDPQNHFQVPNSNKTTLSVRQSPTRIHHRMLFRNDLPRSRHFRRHQRGNVPATRRINGHHLRGRFNRKQ